MTTRQTERMRREIEVDDDAPLAPEEEDDQC